MRALSKCVLAPITKSQHCAHVVCMHNLLIFAVSQTETSKRKRRALHYSSLFMQTCLPCPPPSKTTSCNSFSYRTHTRRPRPLTKVRSQAARLGSFLVVWLADQKGDRVEQKHSQSAQLPPFLLNACLLNVFNVVFRESAESVCEWFVAVVQLPAYEPANPVWGNPIEVPLLLLSSFG